jgi:hypothetical protein
MRSGEGGRVVIQDPDTLVSHVAKDPRPAWGSGHRQGAYPVDYEVPELGVLLNGHYAHYSLASRSRRHRASRGPFPASIPVYSRYLLSSRSRVRIALGALLLP